jgi:hypothetical protein
VEEKELVEFIATFPPILSAIKIDGSGGMRLQFDVPESEMGNAIRLLMWRDKCLKITVEVVEDFRNGKDETNKRAASSPLGMVGG